MIDRKYFKLVSTICFIIGILLFSTFIFTAVLGVFAIGTTEKMTVESYLILLAETFIGRWFFHIPGIALIVLGFVLDQSKYTRPTCQ